jgi:two-component system cell cycle sensor histidine kinase/response regulator CckA
MPPPSDLVADAVVLAASVVATLALAWYAIRQPGPHRSVYAAVALATAAAAAAHLDRFFPWAAWPAAAVGVVAAVILAVSFPRRVAAAERARAEDAGRLALLEAAVGASWDGVMIAEADADDPTGLHVVYANPAFERITGYSVEEAAGLSPSVFCQPVGSALDHPLTPDPDEEAAIAALASVRAALGGSEPARLDVPSRRKDGTRVWSEWQVVPVAGPDGRFTHRVAVIRDMTGRRELETQLRESQKLEAVGRLAGGIAHDFNNLLTVIRGNAELIAMNPNELPDPELVEDIRGAADRATALVRQLLAFGRRQPAKPVVLDVNEVVTDMAGILRRLLGERVAVTTVLAPFPVRARIDRGQFEQVVMNLAVNAKDAMPKGGTLTISTAAKTPDGGSVQFARVAVTDTGVGIPDEVREKIFEPFYTTKAVGKGTGLGLATVYGIVQQAGGRVSVDSVLGAGTTFRVDLPWCDEHVQPRSTTMTPHPAPRLAGGQGRTVLLAEDEDAVRKLTRTALESAGYVVHEAASGEEALALLPMLLSVDVLVTDLTMPGISGRELARLVRAERPTVAVVFISGYHSDIGRLDSIPGAIFLPKPFTPIDLLRVTGKALNRMATRTAALV